MPFLNRFSNRLLLIKNHDHRVPPIPQSYFMGTLGYNDGVTDRIESVIVDSSGNFYMCGSIDIHGCLILKMNSSGVIQWQKKLTDGATTSGSSIAVDSSGNVYVCARYSSSGDQIRIFKYSSSGTLLFKKGITRGNNTSTVPESIAVDSNGNIFVLGHTDLNGYNFYMVKLNTLGVIQFQFNFGGTTSFDLGTSLKLDSSGNVYVAGSCQDSSIFGPLIGKYNNVGTIRWQRRLNTGAATDVNLAVSGSGDVYACYIARPTSGTISNDFGIVKYNTDGVIQWQRRLNSTSSDDRPLSIAVDTEGNAYILGTTDILGSIDFFLAKLNTSGTLIWQRSLTGTPIADDQGKEIVLDSNGNILIVGNSGSISTIFAKLPNDGSRTGNYTISSGRSLNYAATSFTNVSTLFASSSTALSSQGPAFTIFDSFETETTPTLSPVVVTI